MSFTDKDLKYLKNTQKFLSEAKFELTGAETLPIATTMTYIQGTLMPKIEAALTEQARKEKLAEAKSPLKEDNSPIKTPTKKKRTTKKKKASN